MSEEKGETLPVNHTEITSGPISTEGKNNTSDAILTPSMQYFAFSVKKSNFLRKALNV